MTQEELNKLKVGEKAVDIQEYYWGPDGKILTYKVTIYTCVKYLLFFKKIKEYTFPFYFVSKEFALEFLKVYENYEFKRIKICIDSYADIWKHGIFIFPKNIQNQKFNYILISAYHKISTPESEYDILFKNGIWGGIVCTSSHIYENRYWKPKCFNYTSIIEKEQNAAKEGTIGKTYSFKMIEENEKRSIK